MKDDPDTKRGRDYLAGVEELGVTCLGCFWHRAFFHWEDDGRPVEMFSDLASQALEAKCVRSAQLAAAVWCAVNAALLFFRAWLDLDAARGFDELYADLIAAGAPSIAEAWAPRIAMYAAFGLLWLGLTVWGARGGAHAPEMARAQRRTARSRIDPPGKETTMNDVKKTWCGPVYTLDPEKMERQFNRLSAEGWQLEGTGWLSFRYRRGKPNEYRYRVQYLYESRDGQRDDYVRGLAELGVELVMDIGNFLILRRRNDGTPFELFSDLDSRITSEKRYLRTRGLLAAFCLVLAAGPLRRAAVWYGRILEYAADLTAESGIDLPRLWAEGILTDALLGLLWLIMGVGFLRQAYRSAKRLRRLRQARLIEE